MKNKFYLKLVVLFGLIITLLIPKSFLSELIYERIGWREQAYNSIKQSWPGEQTLAGPILTVPYQYTYQSPEFISEGKTQKAVMRIKTITDKLLLIPKHLNIHASIDSSIRTRGIYAVPIYTNTLSAAGEYDLQPVLDLIEQYKNKKLVLLKPTLTVLVRDQRGIAYPPQLSWQNETIAFDPGSNLTGLETGMTAKLPDLQLAKDKRIKFAFAMQLKGMRSADFGLLAHDLSIDLSANWQNPSFTGELLPDQREIGKDGFTAQWRASSFSHNIKSALDACRNNECYRLLDKAVGVNFIQPVDIYQQSERSVKYAFLFISLTFLVLILLELLKKLRVHPIQYTLVGMALLVFYLLLISLSEHISFALAYVIGASACTLLLTLYFGAILQSGKLGLLLGAGISSLYAVLYVILQAEETALLMGSVLIFLLLSVLMLSTRKLDWYALTNNPNTPNQEA